jgi:hypothetical protein
MRAPSTFTGIAPSALIFCLLALCAPALAQSVTIRMINAKNGKPIDGHSLTVEFQGNPEKMAIPIDKHGIGHLIIPNGVTAISLIAATKKSDIQNVPLYTTCGPFGEYIPVKQILEQGFAPQNACKSTPNPTPHPAEIIYLIQPLPWYTPAVE